MARKRGKPIKMPGFMEGSMVNHVKKQLQDAGMKDTEDVFDPITGKKLGGVVLAGPLAGDYAAD